jgi:hypothetical protein
MKKEFSDTYEMIKKYEPSYPEEFIYKEKMLEFISSCDDCFLRSCRIGHFT